MFGYFLCFVTTLSGCFKTGFGGACAIIEMLASMLQRLVAGARGRENLRNTRASALSRGRKTSFGCRLKCYPWSDCSLALKVALRDHGLPRLPKTRLSLDSWSPSISNAGGNGSDRQIKAPTSGRNSCRAFGVWRVVASNPGMLAAAAGRLLNPAACRTGASAGCASRVERAVQMGHARSAAGRTSRSVAAP